MMSENFLVEILSKVMVCIDVLLNWQQDLLKVLVGFSPLMQKTSSNKNFGYENIDLQVAPNEKSEDHQSH